MTHVAFFLPSLDGGGAERVFVQLANRFARGGMQVDFCLARVRGPYLDELDRAVRVVELGTGSVMRALWPLVRFLRDRSPDALLSGLDHANVVALLAMRIARFRGRQIISERSMPSVWYRTRLSLRTRVLAMAMRWTYPWAQRVIVNSDAMGADVESFLSVDGARVVTIGNPVDLARIDAQAAVPVAALSELSAPLVLAIGRLDQLKDFPTLLHAFSLARENRPLKLIILGEGAERTALESQVRSLGLQDDVDLPGFESNPFPYLRAASVLVSSSISEGSPNVVVQALACGTPVVSTRSVGGAVELLGDGRWGRLVDVGDANAMSDAIVATLDDPSPAHGRRRAEEFDIEGIAQRFADELVPGTVL